MANQMANQRVEVFYSGNVQGVGFRYSVLNISQQFDVKGFVKNLPDGRVQLVAQGTKAVIEQFLVTIANQRSEYIDSIDQQFQPVSNEFIDFQVSY